MFGVRFFRFVEAVAGELAGVIQDAFYYDDVDAREQADLVQCVAGLRLAQHAARAVADRMARAAARRNPS